VPNDPGTPPTRPGRRSLTALKSTSLSCINRESLRTRRLCWHPSGSLERNDTAHGEVSYWPATGHNQPRLDPVTYKLQQVPGIKDPITSTSNSPKNGDRFQHTLSAKSERQKFVDANPLIACNRPTLGTVFAKTHHQPVPFHPRRRPIVNQSNSTVWCLFPSHTPKRADRRPYSVGPSRIPQVHYR
jgi:hypothetical protein